MEEDDLVSFYAQQAQRSLSEESRRRIDERTNPEEEDRLRNLRLSDILESDFLVPALLARFGDVRAALDGHGGGVGVDTVERTASGLSFVLDLTGACLSCGAAPGTLQGIKTDLEADSEISLIRFSSSLLDTFDELGREFILAHGQVEFI